MTAPTDSYVDKPVFPSPGNISVESDDRVIRFGRRESWAPFGKVSGKYWETQDRGEEEDTRALDRLPVSIHIQTAEEIFQHLKVEVLMVRLLQERFDSFKSDVVRKVWDPGGVRRPTRGR